MKEPEITPKMSGISTYPAKYQSEKVPLILKQLQTNRWRNARLTWAKIQTTILRKKSSSDLEAAQLSKDLTITTKAMNSSWLTKYPKD